MHLCLFETVVTSRTLRFVSPVRRALNVALFLQRLCFTSFRKQRHPPMRSRRVAPLCRHG